jgi:hypothetical protein
VNGEIECDFLDQTTWQRKAILNTARSPKFSSDRTIREYASDIWNIHSVEPTPTTVNYSQSVEPRVIYDHALENNGGNPEVVTE